MVRRQGLPAALPGRGALGLALALVFLPVQSQAQAQALAQTSTQHAVDLELVLAVDVSMSVDAEEGHLQRQGYVEAFRDPLVVEAIQAGILGRIAVTYFEWANATHTHIVAGWTLIDSPASAARFAAALAQRRPGPARFTSISGALDFGTLLFDDNGFEGSRRVIDVSGDGPNNWGDLVTRARDRAVARGVTINGLPILDLGSGPFARYNIADLDLYYRDCVIGGPAAFIVVAEDFTAFASAIRRKLILEIAGLTPEPLPGPGADAGIRRVQFADPDRPGPPCDIGEQILRRRIDDDY